MDFLEESRVIDNNNEGVFGSVQLKFNREVIQVQDTPIIGERIQTELIRKRFAVK